MFFIYALIDELFGIICNIFFAFKDLEFITFIEHVGMVSDINSVGFTEVEIMMRLVPISPQKHDL